MTNWYHGLIWVDQLAKPTSSIRFSTGTYSFKLETDCNFCNEVKEGVSAIRRFDWSRENIRPTDITLTFVACRFLRKL